MKLYTRNKMEAYAGFLEKVRAWKSLVSWADTIVFDDLGFGDAADQLRRAGKLVVGGSRYTDRLEEDRGFGQREMKKAGISTLEHREFTDFDKAVRFLGARGKRFVFKPLGNTASCDKDMIFAAETKDSKDLIDFLARTKRALAERIERFQLQEFADGVEVAVGAFFNGRSFLLPVNMNVEHKRLCSGDVGPFTGEMGTLMFWSSRNPIFDSTLAKMEPALRRSGYVGYVDINCIVNARSIYPLEFTCRFGYPTISVQIEGLKNDLGTFFHDLAKGESPRLQCKPGFQVGMVVGVPPFPYTDKTKFAIYRNLAIVFRQHNLDGVHLGDVKFVKGEWRLADESGFALVVTGSGETPSAARRQAVKRAKNILLQHKFYRNDIGLTWTRAARRLNQWGYLP